MIVTTCKKCGGKLFLGPSGYLVCENLGCESGCIGVEDRDNARKIFSAIIGNEKPAPCDECGGTGYVDCDECEGTGETECCECGSWVECDHCDDGTVKCEDCRGSGFVKGESDE